MKDEVRLTIAALEHDFRTLTQVENYTGENLHQAKSAIAYLISQLKEPLVRTEVFVPTGTWTKPPVDKPLLGGLESTQRHNRSNKELSRGKFSRLRIVQDVTPPAGDEWIDQWHVDKPIPPSGAI